MRWIAIWTTIVLLGLSGCKKQQGETSEIVVGEYGSLSGSNAVFGQGTHNGIELAVDQVNAAGGLLGKKVRLVTEDDEGNQDEAVSVVKKMIDRDNVVAVLGEVASTRSLAGGSVCEQLGVPMISPSSTNPDVTKDRKYVFRVCFTDDFQGSVGAQFALRKNWKHVAIFSSSNSDYSKKLSLFFKQTFTAAGGEIVAEETYSDGDKEFKAQLTRMQSKNPDAVYLPGYYTEIDLILRQARSLGFTVPFFGGDGWDGVTLDSNSRGAALRTIIRRRIRGRACSNSSRRIRRNITAPCRMRLELPGYDAARVMFDAIKRAGSDDRNAVRDAIEQTKDFPGAGGNITIDENHNAKKPIVILDIHDGKTHLADTIQP